MPMESYVDVLIVGAGPSGLMCANALAMAGVGIKIIDKRPTKVMVGHADGIQPRTLEVLQSYGLAERLLRDGNHLCSSVFYKPSPNGGIECTGRIFQPSSRARQYPWLGLHQGEIEANFIDSIKVHGVEVERSRQPSMIEILEGGYDQSNPLPYPVKVTLDHLDAGSSENNSEIVHAKFVIGADGARSWVRKTFEIEMIGEQTEHVWGVIDMILETNFPDIRNNCVIHSKSGTCMIIPRERDLIRLYIQLSDTDLIDPKGGKINTSTITPEMLLSASRKIFHPYVLADPKEIEWWTVYIVAQQVASNYSIKDRVFIVGDACHTHSAKAGQGMNAGVNDSHNLAWKLTQVLRGWSSPSLLKTYEYERKKFGEELIYFDKAVAGRISGKPEVEKNEENSYGEKFFRVSQEFMSGLGTHYSPSAIVDGKHQTCAGNLVVGKRMPSQAFVRAADSRPIDIHDMLPADTRFKVLFFVGNPTSTRITELKSLAEELSKPSNFLCKYATNGNISTVFDIITIATSKKGDTSHLVFPPFFRPHWSKVLLDETDAIDGKDGHENFGIDPKRITIVIVRPDGFVGTIAPSSALADLATYFGSFMVTQPGDC